MLLREAAERIPRQLIHRDSAEEDRVIHAVALLIAQKETTRLPVRIRLIVNRIRFAVLATVVDPCAVEAPVVER